MGSAVSLREDFDAERLRRLARQTKDAAQARRLLALASIYDGGSRSDAARLGNVTLQIVRDWVLRFNAHGPDGLIDGKAPPAEYRPTVTWAQERRRRPWNGAGTLSRWCRALASVCVDFH
ncbi:helix-turn-helix domain-containing protein [Rhizobium leguminosarum]|nr:helix-turn-helix domain-containing protein [Rhizobium leguminosarum]MBY3027467.1 helix-turn-helix domain-containing protein [Rhizobium leguminosarum]